MGDKDDRARHGHCKAGVPVVPGTEDVGDTVRRGPAGALRRRSASRC
ncbi:MAG: hypothetical protein MZV64_23095 [Ignavibacteriales bacterium]|nr:hypothetical protein [Ignavibacteriales bacterium]